MRGEGEGEGQAEAEGGAKGRPAGSAVLRYYLVVPSVPSST